MVNREGKDLLPENIICNTTDTEAITTTTTTTTTSTTAFKETTAVKDVTNATESESQTTDIRPPNITDGATSTTNESTTTLLSAISNTNMTTISNSEIDLAAEDYSSEETPPEWIEGKTGNVDMLICPLMLFDTNNR